MPLCGIKCNRTETLVATWLSSMQKIYNRASPQSFNMLYGGDERSSASHGSATVTPCPGPGTRASIEREWMARCMMRREAAEKYDNELRGSGGGYDVSPIDRKEVSKAVCGILRDNLPPALDYSTSREELTLIAESIEAKLYQTAPSARAYMAFSTLEFRITALATAVLIYSDKGHEDRNHPRRQPGISDTCARLSAAARKSLVYCVMVLVSYEKRNLEKQQAMMGRSGRMASSPAQARRRLAEGYSPRQQQQQEQQHQGSSNSGMTTEDGYSQEQRAAAEYYLRLCQMDKKYPSSASEWNHNHRPKRSESSECLQLEKHASSPAAGGVDPYGGGDDHPENSENVQNVSEDPKKVPPFPPSA